MASIPLAEHRMEIAEVSPQLQVTYYIEVLYLLCEFFIDALVVDSDG